MYREIHYLSERLATDLADSASARKRGWWIKPSVTVGPPGAKAGASIEKETQAANRHSLADAAYKVSHDEAGTVSEPGRFLSLNAAPVEIFAFKFKGWNKHVSVVRVVLEDSLVVLTGSGANLTGLNESRDGWLPSDAGGARKLFDAWSKDEHPGGVRPDPVGDAVSLIFSITDEPLIRADADVLARVDLVSDHEAVISTTQNRVQNFKRVIVGAPIVVREPQAQPI